ncbi:sulfatase-like hydrolase/transferase [Algisphaera agarilytica]|uniref:Autotransporter-associated beta strand protein n=1 Tax=Algisphaera agarilytica TaxID=1385975 RepID=A0A7X0H4M3_9BACT|nr:sulfatase-like hydrolase/transferase [Algisphaera agarilytica]MBB6429155.1 autotransporter-associated beta strand protein [Algisphaera agarilytica]
MPAQGQNAKNVIVIVADDAGYADFGFMQNNGISGTDPTTGFATSLTPNLDALANRGVTFDRAYVAANCQPTRAAIITGAYQQRIGNESVGNNLFLQSQIAEFGFEGIPDATPTLWDRFKAEGYATGAVGKWHLGSIEGINRPQDQGVDEFYGHWHGSRDYILGRSYNLNQINNPNSALQPRYMRETVRQSDGTVTDTVVEGTRSGEYITNVFGDYGVQFIEDHANEDPFVLYQSFTAPHKPWSDDSPDFNDPRLAGLQGVRKEVGSMMITMDREIGRILDRLEDPNGDGNTSDSIADDTTIVFVNDNGGVSGSDAFGDGTDNGLFPNVKGSPKEGGIRVPMLIAGAGIDESAQGTIYNKPVHGIDILPTVLSLSGAQPIEGEEQIDGVNLLPFINGQTSDDPHEVLVHRWRGTFAVIKDKDDDQWKLVNTNTTNAREDRFRLYNVADDIDESNDLSGNAVHADLIEELKRDLTDYEAFFDKPRYSILARTLEEEPLNVFDHHVFNPNAGSTAWSGGKADGVSYFDASGNPNGTLNWFEAGTNDEKFLLRADGFASAVLEFGTHDSDYTATNDLLRRTGLEFMLNQMVLSGDYTEADNHRATIDGLSVLFTESLTGQQAEIAVDATHSSTGRFTYDLDLDLILYDNLAFTGDGDVTVNVNGTVREYFESRDLIKRGTSTVSLNGQAIHSGATLVEGGTLALIGGAALDQTSSIQISEGATLDASATNTGGLTLMDGQTIGGSGTLVGELTISSGATVQPGSSPGRLTIDGDTTFEDGSTLLLEIDGSGVAGTAYDQLEILGQLQVTGGTLEVRTAPSYNANLGDVFDLLSFDSAQGEFDVLILPELGQGLTWDADSLLTSGTIRVVPEPSTALAILVSGALAYGRRRPRQ